MSLCIFIVFEFIVLTETSATRDGAYRLLVLILLLMVTDITQAKPGAVHEGSQPCDQLFRDGPCSLFYTLSCLLFACNERL